MRDSLSPLIYPPTYSGQKFPQRTYKWQFYPWGDTLLLCKMSVYIQTHKTFPIQKICKSVTKKFFVNNSKSHEATNWQLSRPPTGTVPSPRPSPQATNWQLQATNWRLPPVFRPKYAYCLGTPPAVLGVPPGVLGLPPDVLGTPPGVLGHTSSKRLV